MARAPRALIVDDSAAVRRMWTYWLTDLGFTVVEAFDGADAVKKASERCPDVVLLDLAMPVMDGLEALRRLRAQKPTARVPVIMLSAQEEGADRARALGADGFLLKPVLPDSLLTQLRAVLPRRLLPA